MKWNIKSPSKLQVVKYSKDLNVSKTMASILINRNIDISTADSVLKKPIKLIENPYNITNAKEVAEAIISHMGQGKEFFVFADYDMDGITSGFVMTDYLRSCEESVTAHFPQRSDGYGITRSFCEYVKEASVVEGFEPVIITVDNGIAALDAATYCKEQGIPLIVTDHHEPQATLPDCVFCDPWTDRSSAGHDLAGVGVAWKVCMVIEDITGKGDVEKYIPYVAIGTVGDVMPMSKENASIVNMGLDMINSKKVKTLNTMMDFLGIKKMTAETIAWEIVPKFNSCGRLGNIELAAGLFFMEEEDKVDIKDTVIDIVETDDQRKKITKKATADAEKQDYSQDNICLFDASKYPHGIAGIIAGKLAEKFQKPAFVYSTKEDGSCPASARSINGLDLSYLLSREAVNGTILGFGGHTQACGVTLIEDKLIDFKHGMNQQIANMVTEGIIEVVEASIPIDAEISFGEIKPSLFDEINRIPYDKNVCHAPLFCMMDLKVISTKRSSNNEANICFTLEDKNGVRKDVWGWGLGPVYESLGEPATVDFAGELRLGFGRDAGKPVFNIKDIHDSKTEKEELVA